MRKLVFFILFISFNYHAISYQSETNSKIEYIKIFHTNSNLNYYLFLDINNCKLSIESYNSTINELKRKYRINPVCFILNISESTPDLYNIIDSTFEIIPDRLAAYANLYKIDKTPSFVISDNQGKVLLRSSTNNFREIDSIINNSLASNNITKDKNRKKIRREPDWKYNKDRMVLYSAESMKFYVFIPKTNKMFIIDTSANILNTFKLDLNNSISFYSCNWIIPDSILSFVHNSYSNYREYYKFNLIKDSLEYLYLNLNKLDNYNINYQFYYSNNNTIITSLIPIPNSTISEEFKPLVSISVDKSNIKQFGFASTEYYKNKNVFDCYSILCQGYKNTIIEYSNFTDELRFYNDSSLVLINRVYIPDLKTNIIKNNEYAMELFAINESIIALVTCKAQNTIDSKLLYSVTFFDIHNKKALHRFDCKEGEIPFYVNDQEVLSTQYSGEDLFFVKNVISLK